MALRRTKLYVSGLPHDMTEDVFSTMVVNSQSQGEAPWSWMVYCQGKMKQKSGVSRAVPSHAHVSFTTSKAAIDYADALLSASAAAGLEKEKKPVIEYAPLQRGGEVNQQHRRRGDRLEGTIEADPDYLAFKAALEAPPAAPMSFEERQKAAEAKADAAAARENGFDFGTVPIIAGLRKKNLQKQKVAQAKAQQAQAQARTVAKRKGKGKGKVQVPVQASQPGKASIYVGGRRRLDGKSVAVATSLAPTQAQPQVQVPSAGAAKEPRRRGRRGKKRGGPKAITTRANPAAASLGQVPVPVQIAAAGPGQAAPKPIQLLSRNQGQGRGSGGGGGRRILQGSLQAALGQGQGGGLLPKPKLAQNQSQKQR